MVKKEIEAVIFDLGGTLIEYAGPYAVWPELETPGLQAAYAALQNHGVALPPFAQFRDAAFVTLPGRWEDATAGRQNLRLAAFLRELLGQQGVNGLAQGWLESASRAYEQAVCSQAVLIDGALSTVRTLKEQGYKLALLSNTMFEGTAHVDDLHRFGLDSYFDAMLFSADENKWKPSAVPYLHLLHRLQVPPDRAVFVGDSPEHDIVGGKAAGLRTIYFRSSGRFASPDGVQPDATIERLLELPSLLSRWSREV
ncbi:MAG: HAD family hydrolase [Candidatus Promineifilaceae bacterium]